MTDKPDLTEFYRLSKPKKPPCQIGLILKAEIQPELKPVDRKRLAAALDTDGGIITPSSVVQWLAARSLETNTNRVSNHRRGACTCA